MGAATTRLRELRAEVERLKGKRDQIRRLITASEEKVKRFETQVEDLTKAADVLQTATEARRQELHDRVESLVTRGLRAVFKRDDYEFAFKVQLHRNVFGVIPVLRSDFQGRRLETTIVDGHGGGVADVISFLLRVIVMNMARPSVSQVAVLDESFRHVSPGLLRNVANLLRELNQSAGCQFLLITHKPELLDAADVVYSARLVEGRTEFTLEHDLRDDLAHSRPKRGAVLDRGTSFDAKAMQAPETDARVEWSKTTDFQAERSRAMRPKKKRKKRKR